MVHITPLAGNGTDFAELPTAETLSDFDPADRKLIAVALAYQRDFRQNATILQAVDRKWNAFREAFQQEAVHIDSLCLPEHDAEKEKKCQELP